jgi:hypothetical protein
MPFTHIDYDHDGDKDLVEQINASAGRVLRNNGNGSWASVATPFPNLTFASRMVFADFDSDGDLDTIYQNGNTSGTGWSVQLNNGNGTFAAAINAPASGTFGSGPFNGHTFTQLSANLFFPVDIEKDGDVDLVEQINNATGTLRLQDGNPPRLVSTSPVDNATSVALAANISLTFDRSVTKGTGNIVIRKTADNSLVESIAVTSGLVTGSGTTWGINPTNNLEFLTGYSVTVDAGIFVDTSSKVFPELSGKLTFNFVTTARPATTVASLNRSNSSSSNASTVTWQIVFANPVSGLASGNFSLVNSGLGGAPAISNITAVGGTPATTWNITATTGTGTGTLGLNLANDTALSHEVTNQPFTGQVYTIDRTAPGAAIVLSDTH